LLKYVVNITQRVTNSILVVEFLRDSILKNDQYLNQETKMTEGFKYKMELMSNSLMPPTSYNTIFTHRVDSVAPRSGRSPMLIQ
jgi:hypothetical protein